MSHSATCWALAQRDCPLDQRMLLMLIADRHCPENGCHVDLDWLACVEQIDAAELDRLLCALEAAGRLSRVNGANRIYLAFEATYPVAGEGVST